MGAARLRGCHRCDLSSACRLRRGAVAEANARRQLVSLRGASAALVRSLQAQRRGDAMNLIKSLCVVSLALAALAPSCLVHAQDALVGNWVLDPAKNEGTPGMMPTAGSATIAAAGGGKYTSASEVSVGGMTGRSEITYSVDGKDYAV